MVFGRLQTSPAGLRLSDAEREQAVSALKAHYVDGRLSTEELEARVEDVYRSGTRRQAAAQLRDLPLRGVWRLIARRIQRVQRAALRAHLAAYATMNASLVGIWALTGGNVFWPAWLLIPSTVLLGWHLAASRKLTRTLRRLTW